MEKVMLTPLASVAWKSCLLRCVVFSLRGFTFEDSGKKKKKKKGVMVLQRSRRRLKARSQVQSLALGPCCVGFARSHSACLDFLPQSRVHESKREFEIESASGC